MTAAVPANGPMLRQFLRFGLVGVANTAMCLAIVWTLRDGSGVPVWAASIAGYAVAMVQSYLINRFWTFNGAGSGSLPAGQQIGRFIIANLLCLGLFTAITSLLEPSAGVRIASLIAQVPTTLVSFVLLRFFVFAGPRR